MALHSSPNRSIRTLEFRKQMDRAACGKFCAYSNSCASFMTILNCHLNHLKNCWMVCIITAAGVSIMTPISTSPYLYSKSSSSAFISATNKLSAISERVIYSIIWGKSSFFWITPPYGSPLKCITLQTAQYASPEVPASAPRAPAVCRRW